MEVLSRPPIYDLILAQLSPAGLVRIGTSHTCKLAQAAVFSFYGRAFNINRHLSRFFNDPLAFRSFQARTASLISGSSALQFLDQLGRWLMDREGYEYKPYETQETDFEKLDEREDFRLFANEMYKIQRVEAVFSFERSVQGEGAEPLKVQVIVATQPPLQCILGFHSTVVMNIISYDAAYALYPNATFEKRHALVVGKVRAERDIKAVHKCMQRGWRMQAALYNHPIPDYFEENLVRTVEDGHSWKISLSPQGVEPPRPLSLTSDPLRWDPVVYSSFKLVHTTEVYMWYELVSSTLLRFKYLVADETFMSIIRKFCRSQGALAHMQSSHGAGPGQLFGTEHRTWWDSEMPIMYADM
ncbi:hypothetical protein NEOLEDRAFT_1159954 [Neolentinus lepideus HHB14362 ss-1]|uniref:Uncharacterized protein n=1 Tax=Neolentinus lepideus HHB14362 ss-1 TaxID=1314782 RepID=A0A165W9P6_9AGAM|nr:hypothetical protein NEOLEDRAFT_1159954 [Neolentinus lepideus HHB14362 ss-1]